MNKKQRVIIVITAFFIIGSFLFPPYKTEYTPFNVFVNKGYSFFLDPPSRQVFPSDIMDTIDQIMAPTPKRAYGKAMVSIDLLVLQLTGILVAGGLLFYAAKD